MKKYIENLEEKVSSVLNESLVADAAELVGIEEEDAEERIKGLSFANYIELGNAIDLEDAETAREILSTVAPIEEGKLAKAAAIGTMALGLGAAAADQGTHSTSADDPSWDGPHDVQMSTQRSIDQDDNLTDRSLSVKGPNKKGEYLVTYLDGEEIKRYVTKTPPSVNETASAGGTGAGAVGVSAASGDIGTWDGKAHKKPKKGLKKAGKGIYEDSSDTLYHVTHTKYIPQITKNGLRPMGAPSNWVQQGSGDRYGMGEIYVFTNYEDAKKWAGRMDWDFNQTIGSGEISIITLRYPEGQDFEKDEADPMSQAGQQGDWLKTYEPIEPENIVDVQVFKSMKESMDLLDKPTMTVREIADKHDVPVADIASQLAMGIKVELEHSNNRKVAKEIALDHLMELPDYYSKLDKMENESLGEADNPYAASPSQGSSVDALAQQTQQAEPAKVAGEEEQNELQQRKEVDDLSVGDDIEVIDIDGDPTPVTVKTPRGPGDTLVVQTDKGEEHIVKKQAVSGTPTIQEMYEAAMSRDDMLKHPYQSLNQSYLINVELPLVDGGTTVVPVNAIKRNPDGDYVIQVTTKTPSEGTYSLGAYYASDHPEAKYYSQGKEISVDDAYEIDSQRGEEKQYESALTDRVHEAYNANKTEHSGAKKGKGGYHGRKQDAKRDSNKKRRANDKKAVSEGGLSAWDKFMGNACDSCGGEYQHNKDDLEQVDAWPKPDKGMLCGHCRKWMDVIRSTREITEKAPPGMEDWIKKRKPEFKKRYGDDWESVLYATAWKRHNNESIEENKDEFKKKLVHGDRYFIRREYHIGKKPYDDFEAQVIEVSDTEDTWSGFKHKVRFKDNKGEEIVAWYPEPGKGGLSGRFYDEQLVKAGEKGKYVAGDSRNEWPAVGIDEKFDHYGSDARFIPVEFMGKEVGVVWQEGEGDWHAEVSATGASWGMIDSYKDAVELVQDEAAELVNEGFDPATHVNVEHRDPEGRFIIVHVPPAGYWAVGKGKYQHDIDRTSFDNFDDALEHAELCLSSLGEGFDVNEIRRLAGLKETASAGATGAGAVATAPTAMGGMVRRSPSIYDKPKPKKRTKESSDDGIGRAKKK